MFSVALRPANRAAGIRTCLADFEEVLCALSPAVPCTTVLAKTHQGETGQHLSRCFPSWLGLKSYTKRLGLVWVSLLPQGWGGVWQLFHPLRVPFSVYLAERGACG